MKAKIQMGELLIARQLVSKEQINEALHIQVSGNRRLGYLLIKMGLITDKQLVEILAEQLELPIIDVDKEFMPKVKNLIPRYICYKYSVFPLHTDKDNILSLAMADPLDYEAISNVENYTGMVVKPSLTFHKDISRAIKKYIPFTPREVLNPQVFNHTVKFISVIAVILLLVTSLLLARYVYHEQYGTTSKTGDAIVYKNHDLMLGLEKDGKVSLLGRAARAEGYYSVTFDKTETLKEFIEYKKNYFSEKQADWLRWIIKNRIEKKASSQG